MRNEEKGRIQIRCSVETTLNVPTACNRAIVSRVFTVSGREKPSWACSKTLKKSNYDSYVIALAVKFQMCT